MDMKNLQENNILVSIIIPVYNVEAFLEKCIKSITNTPFNDIEIILIDDGSKDSSLEVCYSQQRDDKRIKVIEQKNGGVSSARNEGLLSAKGKYIIFADADDYYPEGALEKIINMLRGENNLECIWYGYERVSNKEKIPVDMNFDREYSKKDIAYIAEEYWNLYRKALFNPVWNKVYRLDIIRNYNIKFDIKVTMGEDALFNLQYLSHCSYVIFVNQILYCYVRHGDQASTRKHNNYFYMQEKEFNEIERFITKYTSLNADFYKEWLNIIKLTCYHQNFKFNNKLDVLDNRHTANMCEKIIPWNFIERCNIWLIKNRFIRVFNFIYYMKSYLVKIKKRWKVKV